MLSATGWLAQATADLRCGIDRLLVKMQAELGSEARDGGAYVFRNRTGTRIKVLCVDAQGVWLSVRRLHEGSFTWPRAGAVVWRASAHDILTAHFTRVATWISRQVATCSVASVRCRGLW